MNYSNELIKLSFTIDKDALSIPVNEGVGTEYATAFEYALCDGNLIVSIGYAHKDKPLNLYASAKDGDGVTLVFRPYRIELHINAELADEEWPFGRCLLSDVVLPEGFDAEYFEEQDLELPSVITEFEGGEGWRPAKNVFVGDCMPYSSEGRYHVLFLYDRHHHASKWNLGAHQWAHISTVDFKTWQLHPMAVPVSDPDEASICTGSFFDAGEKKYLFYAVRQNDFWKSWTDRSYKGLYNQIRRSVSEDGYHFEKDKDFGFHLSDRYLRPSSRDPKVYEAGGKYHMTVTTSIVSGENAGHGCLAHLVSDDLNEWREAGEIFVSPDASEPECSDMIYYHGRYYLIFSLPGAPQYLWTEDPDGEWRKPNDCRIPCKTVPKGAVFNDKIIFTGFDPIGDDGNAHYAGQMTFRSAHEENGELIFE